MKAVIYCRVSTKEQAQNLSLPTQLRACREYCSRNGLTVVEVFEDAGESAKTTDRPEFKRLLEYCRENKGQVGVLVVYNVTRFARNDHDHAIIRTLLHRLGVSLRSVNEPIGDDSVGKLTENMLAAIAQFDNDVKSERTTAGRWLPSNVATNMSPNLVSLAVTFKAITTNGIVAAVVGSTEETGMDGKPRVSRVQYLANPITLPTTDPSKVGQMAFYLPSLKNGQKVVRYEMEFVDAAHPERRSQVVSTPGKWSG